MTETLIAIQWVIILALVMLAAFLWQERKESDRFVDRVMNAADALLDNHETLIGLLDDYESEWVQYPDGTVWM